MGGDLFEILFVIAFILFGILGGKKKKKPGAGQSRPAPRQQASRSPSSVGPRQAGQTTQDALLRELEGILTGRRPAPQRIDHVPDPDEARSLETLDEGETNSWEAGLEQAAQVEDTTLWHEGRDRETRSAAGDTALWHEGRDRAAGSLETLEGAGEASHSRFHQRYGLTAVSGLQRKARSASFDLGDMRRAVILAEILGPPVSER
ncbi:MAG: hypothetical protein OEY20_10350 [Gemmatimonadota bacterium]|nr:hypothetical protein [Gemmatimonadota bacterium]MDH5197642.1 hypothetical protein [Gemmatimonadota bacterium]